MSGVEDLLALADRVEALGDITCPLCGETDFDVAGFVFSHQGWCEVQATAIAIGANRNSEIAAAIRARSLVSLPSDMEMGS
jgi:hypothetical protein